MGEPMTTRPATGNDPRPANLGLTAAVCAVFVAGMLGMSFAAVPLYRIFCQVTGFGGTTQRAEAAPAGTLDRTVTVRLDGNVSNGLGWSFRPVDRAVRVKLGEVGVATFVAENRGGRATTGTAAFNVTPEVVGAYFNKIACFCFTEQTLAPGESTEMAVSFFVDPAFADDPDLRATATVTLSYTWFPAAPSSPLAAASTPREQAL
jgi:cytochrome c oxidase assembly protein subunit 11